MVQRRQHRSVLRLFAALSALPLAQGCAADVDAPDAIDRSAPEIRSPLAERVVPIRVFLLNDNATRSTFPTTDASIVTAIRDANRLFMPTGVQFELAGVQVINSPMLARHDYSTLLTWPQVRSEIRKIVPTATFPDTATAHVGHWLNATAALLPTHEVSLFLALNQNHAANSSFPWYDTVTAPWTQDWSHGIRFNAWDIGALGHELGHYFGLVHTWDVVGGDPERDAAYYYDLVYAVSGTGVRVFSSEADARSVLASTLLPKDYANCSVVAVNGVPDATCNLGCTLNGRSYTTRDNLDVLRGLAFSYNPGEPYGVNAMSYLTNGVSLCNTTFAPSQIRRIRDAARSARGQRDSLGHFDDRFPSSVGGDAWRGALDFDGDGRRDLAAFRPSTGQCLVYRSRDGVQRTISIPGYTAATGDIPVPADYDNDGVTDCAVFRPGRSDGDWRAHWFWAKSSTGNTAGVHDTFGATGDIPLPGLDFLAATGEYAVYRPSSATFFWVRAPGGDGQPVSSRQFGVPGDVLLPGRYDADARTDIAVFRPGAGYLSITTSGANYTDVTNYDTRSSSFGAAYGWVSAPGDRVMRGVDRDGDGRTDFALWRPADGVWRYLLRAATSGTAAGQSQQWGAAGDVAFSGFDFDGDGRSDEAVFRPNASVVAPGNFYVRRSRDGGSRANAFGRDGLLPLVLSDRDGDNLPELVAYEPAIATWNVSLSANGTWPAYWTYRLGSDSDIPL